jgi:UDP-N-acetylmuramate dehydrogenase
MTIQENISLAQYTTFKIGGAARYFCSVKDINEVRECLEFAKKQGLPIFVLGGGSNILISDEGFKGLVIKIEIFGKNIDPISSVVSVGAGELWDYFVEFSILNGLNGVIEN